MSSTSSSECLCEECFQYGATTATAVRARTRTPFHQTLGQPLIYYAQVQPQTYNKRSRESRKDNCFVKAFRWYTQGRNSKNVFPPFKEHPPPRPEAQCRRTDDLAGFAAWLDVKCEEFQQNKQAEQCCRAMPYETCDADRNNTGEPCEPRRIKTVIKARSPWRKKQRHVNSKECGCPLEKFPQSLEFIMEPKDLSRPASEYCQQTSLNNRSKASAISTEIHASKRLKSRSSERNVNNDYDCTPVEINQNEGPNIGVAGNQVKTEYRAIPYVERPAQHKSEVYTKEVSCQCPEKKLVTVNTETQYQELDLKALNNKTSVMSYCITPLGFPKAYNINERKNKPAIYVREEMGRKEGATSVSCQCSLRIISRVDTVSQYEQKYIDVGCCCTTGCDLAFVTQNVTPVFKEASLASSTRCEYCPAKSKREQKPVKCLDNKTSTVIELSKCRLVKVPTKDYAAQTSDNAIDLEKDGVRNYPLFMKIVYADKLKEEFTVR